MWEEIAQAIYRARRFVLTTHANPDGDGLGAEIALSTFFRGLGKESTILNATPLPRQYHFLDPHGEIQLYEPSRHDTLIYNAQVIFLLDLSAWGRLGPLKEPIESSPAIKICMDHHPYYEGYADLAVVREDASSTGELVYELIASMNVGKFNRRMAEALYLSILADTGSFRFPNTTAKSHRIAAHLVELGAVPAQISHEYFERYSWERAKLLGHALLNSQLSEDGAIGWMEITREDLSNLRASQEETEGFLDVLRCVDQLKIAVLFVELGDGEVKVSLRSKGKEDVHNLAKKLGGGGHRKAAGCVVPGPMRQAVKMTIGEVRKLLGGAAE